MIVLLAAIAILALVIYLFVVVVSYLKGCITLLTMIRRDEPELYQQLHQPNLFKPFPNVTNYFRGLLAFIGWFLKGGKGAKHSITTFSALKVRRLLMTALLLMFICGVIFLGLFILFGLISW